jgi:hypothetical protein
VPSPLIEQVPPRFRAEENPELARLSDERADRNARLALLTVIVGHQPPASRRKGRV